MGFWKALVEIAYVHNRPLGRKAGRAFDAHFFGWKFPCPWPECGYNLLDYWAAEQFVKVCPACRRGLWWAKNGTEPRKAETPPVESSGSAVESGGGKS